MRDICCLVDFSLFKLSKTRLLIYSYISLPFFCLQKQRYVSIYLSRSNLYIFFITYFYLSLTADHGRFKIIRSALRDRIADVCRVYAISISHIPVATRETLETKIQLPRRGVRWKFSSVPRRCAAIFVRLALGQILLLYTLPLLSLFSLFSRAAHALLDGRKRLASSGKRRGARFRAHTGIHFYVACGPCRSKPDGVMAQRRTGGIIKGRRVSSRNSDDDDDDDVRPRRPRRVPKEARRGIRVVSFVLGN